MEEAAGVTVIDVSDADVTVNVVDAETLPKVAVIVVDPAADEVAKPFDPVALLIDATPALDELQVTADVRL